MADATTTSGVDAEAQALEERLKSALWLHVGRIVDDETIKLGVNATPQFIGSLTELVWAQIETVAIDLESFATHAGRATIRTEDVMLLTRRNDGLREILDDFVVRLAERNAAAAAEAAAAAAEDEDEEDEGDGGGAKGKGKRKDKGKGRAKAKGKAK